LLTSIRSEAKTSDISNCSVNEVIHHNLLVDLLTIVKLQGYRFTTVTPTTHQRTLLRKTLATNLHEIFGWNLYFSPDMLSPMLRKLMIDANIVETKGNYWRSKLRISSLGHDLFLHSAFPTLEQDAIFFGPDTYRFANFIRHSLEKNQPGKRNQFQKPLRILDIGCGTGAGGIAAVRALLPDQNYELTMNDINPHALDLTMVNAQAAGVSIKLLAGNIFDLLNEEFDLIVANPPYMKDEAGRSYRDGGKNLGLDFSLRILKKACQHLAPAGRLLLYTGVAMTGQTDPFLSSIEPFLKTSSSKMAFSNEKEFSWAYEEIDPDIFGEELDSPAYSNVCRIAAVGLTVNLEKSA
jgi:methylase of polypeptide subunit release factors